MFKLFLVLFPTSIYPSTGLSISSFLLKNAPKSIKWLLDLIEPFQIIHPSKVITDPLLSGTIHSLSTRKH